MSTLNHFPKVGIFASNQFAQLMANSANSLGIDLVHLDAAESAETLLPKLSNCELVTFIDQMPAITTIKTLERAEVRFLPGSTLIGKVQGFKPSFRANEPEEILLTVARSPHGQAATWAPTLSSALTGSSSDDTKSDDLLMITPAPELSESIASQMQSELLNVAAELGLVGLLTATYKIIEGVPELTQIHLGAGPSAIWSIAGSVTSQFEQHLRAVLDLPLGDTALVGKWCLVCATNGAGNSEQLNLYRPYLHLMARTPALKFIQNEGAIDLNQFRYLTLIGSDLEFLKTEMEHAASYFKGEIDE